MTDVDICNLALAHLGDVATVSSIDPPEGSAQAAHCARFYPIARNALLEMHTWAFATKRAALTLYPSNPSSTWAYCYAAPADVLNFISVLDPQAFDDYSTGVQMAGVGPYSAPVVGLGVYTPQPFHVETDEDGDDVIYTDVQNAVLRYTFLATNPAKFTPTFSMCLSHMLASMLAGPLLKGEVGMKVAQEQRKLAMAWDSIAEASDANQRQIKPAIGAAWMVNRG